MFLFGIMKICIVFGKVFSGCNSYFILSIWRFSDYNIYFIKFVGFFMIGSSDNLLIFIMVVFNIMYLNICFKEDRKCDVGFICSKILICLIYIIKLIKMCFGFFFFWE